MLLFVYHISVLTLFLMPKLQFNFQYLFDFYCFHNFSFKYIMYTNWKSFNKESFYKTNRHAHFDLFTPWFHFKKINWQRNISRTLKVGPILNIQYSPKRHSDCLGRFYPFYVKSRLRSLTSKSLWMVMSSAAMVCSWDSVTPLCCSPTVMLQIPTA